MKDGDDHLTRPASLPWTRQEHDACALIANIREGGHASHGNVKRTLEALTRMGHRTGEVNGEGDGCGLLTDIPRRLWGGYPEQEGYPGALAQASRFFVAHIFIPAAQRQHAAALQQRITEVFSAHGCNVFVARPGPVRSSALGSLGRRDEPIFWQTAGILRSGEPESVDSHLLAVHLTLERELPIHVVSLSSHSVTAYVNALRESDQGAEADRVATYMNDWPTRFVKIVPVGQLLDQEVSTEEHTGRTNHLCP